MPFRQQLVRVAATGEPVACICGDGAFQMHIQELEWVVRGTAFPITMIVMNNHALGMIRHLQRDYFDNVYADTTQGHGFSSCNFEKVAKAYGITAISMTADEVKRRCSSLFTEGRARGAKSTTFTGNLHGTGNICLPENMSWGSRFTISSHMHRKILMIN